MTDARLMQVRCLPLEHDENGRLQQRVQAMVAGEVLATVNFWSEPGSEYPMRADGRTALLTFLPLAMRLGTAIEVLDELDPLSLMYANEWQEVMACWHQQTLQPVTIRSSRPAASLRCAAGTHANALMAFSGGVDSCHTLWRHSAARQVSSVRVKAGLLVHGMDIPLSDRMGFSGARKRAEVMLRAHGAGMLSVATDIRSLERQFDLAWETHTHGIVLAACLSLFEKSFDTVLIASTYPVHDVRLPWGSNPISDFMLGGAVPYFHDGSVCNKRAKVADFAKDPVLTDHLRVCWEGDRKDANCGQCFKCLTTQASLWLAGVPSPAAFDRPARVTALASMPIRTGFNHRLVSDLLREAKRTGRHDMVRALNTALRKSRWNRRRSMLAWLGIRTGSTNSSRS